MPVERGEGAGFRLEELDELGSRAAELGRGRAGVMTAGLEDVEGLGQQRGEVVVLGVDDDATPAEP